MAQIGKAWIEVRADLVKFPAELKTKLQKAIKDGLDGVSFDGLSDKAAEAGTQAANKVADNFASQSRARSKNVGVETGKGLLSGITSVFKSSGGDGKGGFFSGIFGGFKDAFAGGLSGVTGQLGQVGQLFGQLGNIGGVAGGLVQFAAIGALIPIILGMAGALIQLSGALLALPAAGAAAIGIFAPLIIAFQGIGEAISAGMSGDVDKFNEALKGLAPSARGVVREFVSLKPLLDSIKKTVQQSFFAPLVGEVSRFGKIVLPSLEKGLGKVASALGYTFKEILRVFSSPAAVQTFNRVLETSLSIAYRMEPAFTRLFDGLLDAIGPALPFVEKFVFFLLDGLGMLGDWLGRISKNGQLTKFLEDATTTGMALWDVLKGMGQYIFTLLSSFGGEGTTMLQDINTEIQDLVEYLSTPEGAKLMENLGVAISAVGAALVWFLSVVPYLLTFFSNLISATREIDDILGAIGSGFVALMVGIWNFLKGAGSAIAAFFTEDIPRWFGQLVDWFASLPDMIGNGATSLKDTLVQWLTDALLGMYNAALRNIGLVIGVLLSLPGTVLHFYRELPGKMKELFDWTWAYVFESTTAAWDNITGYIGSIPGRLAAAGEAILAWGSNLWTTVTNFAENTVRTGYDKVVGFFAGLPARIAAFGPALFNAAVGLGKKIGEGLSNIGDFASDVGKKIVAHLKTGINYVINGVNRGIADIDAVFPGDLPRIPTFARGGIVDTPTVGLFGEAGREVILPLTDPKRTQELAEESGLLSMLQGVGGRSNVQVIVYLDPTGAIIPVTRTVVNDMFDQQGQELADARA